MLRAAAGPYDLTLVSPRNYFLYTPLLPSAATGTVEPRSIVDPVRSHIPDTVRPQPDVITVLPYIPYIYTLPCCPFQPCWNAGNWSACMAMHAQHTPTQHAPTSLNLLACTRKAVAALRNSCLPSECTSDLHCVYCFARLCVLHETYQHKLTSTCFVHEMWL